MTYAERSINNVEEPAISYGLQELLTEEEEEIAVLEQVMCLMQSFFTS